MINVIGLGPGNTDYITKLGEKLIQNSDVVIGGKRNLESIVDFEGEKIEISSNLKEIVEYINNNKLKSGTIFLVYLIAYSLGRVWIESFRIDSLMFGFLRIAQIVSLSAIAFGIFGLIWLYIFKKSLPDVKN